MQFLTTLIAAAALAKYLFLFAGDLSLAQLALSFVPLLVDETPAHHHFQAGRMPVDAAEAFERGCTEKNPFSADHDGRLCVAFLVVMAGEESGFNLQALGDCRDPGPCDEFHRPRARGPFQEHTGTRDERQGSWIKATRHYLDTVAIAVRVCPDQPIAPLAGERCGSSNHHLRRWAQISMLAHHYVP